MIETAPATLAEKAETVAEILKALGNGRRLMVLCHLMEVGEQNVNRLAEIAGLGQPAMSQHLAKMREDGIVRFRRDNQTLWYRIADERINALMGELYRIYCKLPEAG